MTYPSSTSYGTGAALAISGNFAYVACAVGVRAVNITNPAQPTTAGQTATNLGGTPLAVAVSGHYIFLANGTDGLRVFAVQPRLGVSQINGNSLVFTWPNQSLFLIQQNSDLTQDNWLTLTNEPAVIGANAQVNLPPPGSNTFYRLLGQ